MSPQTIVCTAATAVIVAVAIPAQAQEAPNTPEKRAQEAAAKGPDALRWFVQRTRMIYGLSVYDFRLPE